MPVDLARVLAARKRERVQRVVDARRVERAARLGWPAWLVELCEVKRALGGCRGGALLPRGFASPLWF